MGAPLAWAGFSSTVMVVAVSFKQASDPSYSSSVGAARECEERVIADQAQRTDELLTGIPCDTLTY